MKQFNWDTAYGTVSKEWLRKNHKLPLTEEEYIQGMKSLGRSGKFYSSSRLRKQYRNLRERFGFFQDETYPED